MGRTSFGVNLGFRKNEDGSISMSGPVDFPVLRAGKIGWTDKLGGYSTFSGTYTGNGSSQNITLSAKPSLLVVRGASSSNAIRIWSEGAWYGRAVQGAPLANPTDLSVYANTFTVSNGGTASSANVNGVVYQYFAIFDPFETTIASANYAGNLTNGRTVDLFKGRDVAATIFKRDNTPAMAYAITGYASDISGAAAVGITKNSDGTYTLDSSNAVNGGEGNQMIGFLRSPYTYATEYTVSASSVAIFETPFDDIEAFFVFPKGDYSVPAAAWFSSDSTPTNSYPFTAAAVQTTAVTSVDRGRIALASGTYNTNGNTYVLIAFAKVRTTPAFPAVMSRREVKNPNSILLGPSTYFNCGTDDSLNVVGPMSLEWFGISMLTASATSTGNTDTNSRCIFARGSGAYATAGNMSYGLWLGYSPDTADTASLWVAISSTFDWSTAGNFKNSPWQSGLKPEYRRFQHYVAVTDGAGTWNIYVNGMLRKELKRPDLLLTGGSGHKMCIGGMYGPNATPDMAASYLGVSVIRIYPFALSQSQVDRNLLACGTPRDLSAATPGFTEEWRAENFNAGTGILSATVRAENNGTIVGSAYKLQRGL